MKKGIVLLALLIIAFVAYWGYDQIYNPTSPNATGKVELNIPSGASLEQVGDLLKEKKLIRNKSVFNWIAEKKNYYTGKIKPGKFSIPANASLNNIINKLRLGGNTDVKFTFNNIFSLDELAGRAGAVLEGDSIQFAKVLHDNALQKHYGFTEETFATMFIPNTYAFKHDTSPEDFVKRMAKEFKTFWNAERTQAMDALKLTPSEVVTVASIVQAEQQAIPSEWKRIAGLYLNRIRKSIPLQSDPTVKFAVGDWSIKRVLNKHLEVDNPYNTYKYSGIPPGPILFPDIGAVDAVLHAEKHSYYYMCAKADFSGKHEFAKNLSVHNKYAAAYRKALNNRKIYN